MKPREYTNEEVRTFFLEAIWDRIESWDKGDPRILDEEGDKTPQRARLEGLAYSILALLDGASMDMPGFVVAPDPHPDDQEFDRSQGQNWFPQTPDLDTDIAGDLHYEFYQVGRESEGD